MTSGETNTIYQELVSFLSSSRSDIRKAAAEATLAALSTSDDNENDTAATMNDWNVFSCPMKKKIINTISEKKCTPVDICLISVQN